MAIGQQLLLVGRYPRILQRIVRHEDVVEDCHGDAEGARKVEKELPAKVVNDGSSETEEHPAGLDAKEDADAHLVELRGEEPVEGEGGNDRGEDRGVESCEESEDGGDVVAALGGKEGGEKVEEAGEAEGDGKDEPLVVDVVHKEGHQGANHDAHAEEGRVTLRNTSSAAEPDN